MCNYTWLHLTKYMKSQSEENAYLLLLPRNVKVPGQIMTLNICLYTVAKQYQRFN